MAVLFSLVSSWVQFSPRRMASTERCTDMRESSVADPDCLSRIHIFPILYLGSNNKTEEGKIVGLPVPFYVAINFTATNCRLFYFWTGTYIKKFEPIDKEFKNFYQKNCYQALKMSWGSGIRKKPILVPGSGKKAPEPRSAAVKESVHPVKNGEKPFPASSISRQ